MNMGALLRRTGGAATLLAAFVAAEFFASPLEAAKIAFDIPSTVECREVTPPEFAAHDYLKVIEGKLRISARFIEGSESDVVDFVYTITCPDKRVRFQDYLPNTTLESTVADDQIEIKDATERASSAGANVHVVYKLLALGGSLNQSSKNTESSQYRQITSRELVVASGTIEREHGVFFRLRPSRASSLEGAKEFTFLATVPAGWRGDLCTISCVARGSKDSFFSSSVVEVGSRVVKVGMHLIGDVEAASLAEELRQAQESHAKLLADVPAHENVFVTFSDSAANWFGGKKKSEAQARQDLEEVEQAVADVEQRIKQLAR